MSDDSLTALPLKSLELPTKTVAKIKPLGVKTIGDLYALTPQRLFEAGLVLREVEEIAEAAADFGVAWSSVADVRAAGPAAPAKPISAKPAKSPRPATPKAPFELPEEVASAFRSDPNEPIGLTTTDIAFFESYVDETKRHFRTPPPSARHLRLVRRIVCLKDESIGGAVRTFVVGVVDVSQLPVGTDIVTFLNHMGNLLSDVLERIGAKPRAQLQVGSATVLTIAAKDVARANAFIRAHEAWVGASPAHLREVPAALTDIAQAGLAQLESTA